MAFDLDGLYQIGPGGNSPRLWIYSTADTIASVIAADYFLAHKDQITLNDVFLVISSTGGTPVVTITYCNQSDGSVVDMVAGNTILATDAT